MVPLVCGAGARSSLEQGESGAREAAPSPATPAGSREASPWTSSCWVGVCESSVSHKFPLPLSFTESGPPGHLRLLKEEPAPGQGGVCSECHISFPCFNFNLVPSSGTSPPLFSLFFFPCWGWVAPRGAGRIVRRSLEGTLGVSWFNSLASR